MKCLIVILCTYILFLLIPNKWVADKNSPLQVTSSNPTGSTLARAFVLGQKKDLDKQQYGVYLELGLVHLFTLSGLHLRFFKAPFQLISTLFSRLMIMKNSWIILQLAYVVFLLPFWNFSSMRRILFFCLTYNFLKAMQINKSPNTWAFVTAFLLDFLLGSYLKNPYSFTLSFLFLGILVHGKDKLETTLALLGGYFLINQTLGQDINYFGFAIGQVVTYFFSPIFFFAIINLILTKIQWEWLATLAGNLLEQIHQLLFLASTYSVKFKLLEISSLPLFLLLLKLFKNEASQKLGLALLLFCHSWPMPNEYWPDPSRIHFLSQYFKLEKKELSQEGDIVYLRRNKKRIRCQLYFNRNLECQDLANY